MKFRRASVLCFAGAIALQAGDTLPGLTLDQVSFSGYGSFVNTRVLGFYNLRSERPPQWNTFAVLNLVLNMKFAARFTGHIGLEGYTYHNTIALANALMPVNKERQYATIYPHQVEGRYSLGDPDLFKGEIGIGLMPYKYNRDAWSLGEYLFRSGTYPGYLITDFDWAVARLTGFRFSTVAFREWRNDLLLTINMELPPYHDANVSWITGYSLRNIIDIGAGISFCSLISANEHLTTPENEKNVRQSDTIVDPVAGTIVNNSYYTFRGTKAMCRTAADPLFFLKGGPFFTILGIPIGLTKDDGRIYAELAVLGLENQSPGYDKIADRMPVMAGFNLPTLGLFDALSFQAEYYPCPYPNDFGGTLSYSQPGFAAPFDQTLITMSPSDSALYANDNWKWSIHGRRFIGTHFGIVIQAARDHWRTVSSYDINKDYSDALVKPKHWYLATKLVVVF
ncbi:MAG: hypothetical protein JW768_01940 [Chitinispirillaceae bacterium]|nr:hypothetical protein [Chitinispirillaceae bacterium]